MKFIKNLALFILLIGFSFNLTQSNTAEAQVYFSAIDSPDTFASDVEYHYVIIAPDWVVVFQQCPGIMGLCA